MDIHRPKAAHSVREFLIEIGTIICGILIALGLEQGIEALHQDHLRHEAREAIRGEISQNIDAFRRRSEVQRCVDARLVDLERLLSSTPLGAKLPRPLWVGRPQVWSTKEDRWAASTSSARTALLPPGEQAGYSEIYSQTRKFDDLEKIEQLAWTHLRTLETLPSLDATSQFELTEALHEARYANFRIKVGEVQTRELARAVGIAVGRSPMEQGSRSVCIPLNTPRDEALRLATKGRVAAFEP